MPAVSKAKRQGGRHGVVLAVAGVAWLGHAIAWAALPPQAATRPAATAATGQPVARHGHGHAQAGPGLPPERARQRRHLLHAGEAALMRRDAEAALQAFEAAGQIAHSADAELGIVRAQMQAGRYRDALGFASHVAGAHLDAPEGAAYYAWLLRLGGQAGLARRVMDGARQREPHHPMVRAVAKALESPAPWSGAVRVPAGLRLVPYGDMQGLPARVKVVSSGTPLAGGSRVLVPAEALRPGPVWVRNAQGDLRRARLVQSDKGLGVSLLQLDDALPGASARNGGDAFPGSVAVTVQFSPSAGGGPAWPWLQFGFVGPAQGVALRRLEMPLPTGQAWRLGGPVFSRTGGVTGVVIGRRGSPQMVTTASLIQRFGRGLFAAEPVAAVDAARRTGLAPALDELYEQALRGGVVQVLQGKW